MSARASFGVFLYIKAEERWGSGIVEQVSLDLQAAFPESKGFSAANLWRMKQWYLFYSSSAEKLAQIARVPEDKGKKIQEQLPSIEELKARIRMLEEELNKGE